MTSSVLAALIAIATGIYIFFAPRRLHALALVIMLVTLGYIAGSTATAFGGWIAGLVSGVTTFVNWIAGVF